MDEAQRQQLIAYRRRWEAVAAIERQEEAERSLEERWMRLNFLYGFARALGVAVEVEGSEEEIWQRWAILRQTM